MPDRQAIPVTNRAKLIARIGEWLDRAEAAPLAIGEHHTITFTVAREESGGFTWASREGMSLPNGPTENDEPSR